MLRCEFSDPSTGSACNARACASHMYKWQVFGPQKNGLALCNSHRGVNQFTETALVYQIAVGTAARAARWARIVDLPTLQAFQHSLRKSRGRTFDLREIDRMVQAVFLASLHDGIRTAAAEILARHRRRVPEQLRRAENSDVIGREYYSKLKAHLVAIGKYEFAELLEYCAYSGRSNLLFVNLPEHLRGRFAGTDRVHLRSYSAAIGIEVRLEKSGGMKPR
jgi:hypothetical protein